MKMVGRWNAHFPDRGSKHIRRTSRLFHPTPPVALLLINPRISAYEISCTSCLNLMFRSGQHTQTDALKNPSTTTSILHSNPRQQSRCLHTTLSSLELRTPAWASPMASSKCCRLFRKDGQDIQGHPYGQQHTLLVLSRSSSGYVEAISKRYNGLLPSRQARL